MNHFWRLREYSHDNRGLACTDDGLLLGHTSLVERRAGRFVVRDRGEIERLLKRVYHGELPVDRLMRGLAAIAAALNANDQCLARIAAVHLKIPDLPSPAARDALAAEDSLIKYARGESGGADWNPALHPTHRRAAQSRMVRADGRRKPQRFAGANCSDLQSNVAAGVCFTDNSNKRQSKSQQTSSRCRHRARAKQKSKAAASPGNIGNGI